MHSHTLYLLGKGALAAVLIALASFFFWLGLKITLDVGRSNSLPGPAPLWNLTGSIGMGGVMLYFLFKIYT